MKFVGLAVSSLATVDGSVVKTLWGLMATIQNYQGQLASQVQKFRSLGQKEAGSHRPATDATHPDANEGELRSQAEGLIANEQTLFDAVVADANRTANNASSKLIDLRSDIYQVLADDTLASQVEAELAGERKKLVDATAERIKAEVEWRAFRARNGITDLPNYPESQIFHWSIIFMLILLETVVNAFFYQNANGLIGGFVVAAAVAAVNMGSAVILGNAFRRKNLHQTDQQVIGWSSLVLFVPLAIFCNALFASFRSVYQLIDDPSDPVAVGAGFREAWTEAGRIFILDYQFGDLSSFVLFMLGIILSVFAFWKGYTSDDPYPGYSRRDKALKRAKRDEEKKQELVKQRVKDFLVSHRNRVQGLTTQTGALISSLSGRASALKSAENALPSNVQAVQRDYALVLDAYRQANLAVRGTKPPAYFKEVPDLTAGVTAASAEDANERLIRSLQELEALQAKHRDGLNAKLTALQLQMAEVMTGTYDQFLLGVEEDAKKRVQADIQIMPQAS
jgi:hypothetical protein